MVASRIKIKLAILNWPARWMVDANDGCQEAPFQANSQTSPDFCTSLSMNRQEELNAVCYVLELRGIHQEAQDLNFFKVEAAYLVCSAFPVATKAQRTSKSHSSLLSPRKLYWVFVKVKNGSLK